MTQKKLIGNYFFREGFAFMQRSDHNKITDHQLQITSLCYITNQSASKALHFPELNTTPFFKLLPPQYIWKENPHPNFYTMPAQSDAIRISELYQMLYELAGGNFTVRCRPTGLDDPIERLRILIETVASQLQKVTESYGYVNSGSPYQSFAAASVVISKEFLVRTYSESFADLLRHKREGFINMNFTSLIAARSLPAFTIIEADLRAGTPIQSITQIYFTTGQAKLLPMSCIICRLVGTDEILITSVSPVDRESLSENLNQQPQHRKSDGVIINEIRNYILAQGSPTANIVLSFYRQSKNIMIIW